MKPILNIICPPNDPISRPNDEKYILLAVIAIRVPIILEKAPTMIKAFLPKKPPKIDMNKYEIIVPINIIRIELFIVEAESLQR